MTAKQPLVTCDCYLRAGEALIPSLDHRALLYSPELIKEVTRYDTLVTTFLHAPPRELDVVTRVLPPRFCHLYFLARAEGGRFLSEQLTLPLTAANTFAGNFYYTSHARQHRHWSLRPASLSWPENS